MPSRNKQFKRSSSTYSSDHLTSSEYRSETENDAYSTVTESPEDDASSIYSSSSQATSLISQSDLSSDDEDQREKRVISPPFKNLGKKEKKKKRKPEPTFEEFMKYQQKQQQKMRQFQQHRRSLTSTTDDSYTQNSISLSSSDSEEDVEGPDLDASGSSSTGIHHHHHHYPNNNNNNTQNTNVTTNDNTNGETTQIPTPWNLGSQTEAAASALLSPGTLDQANRPPHISPHIQQSNPHNSVHSNLNRSTRLSLGSIGNTSSFSISANNSRAVLSALKSLQNKIKNLEEEVDTLRKKLEEEKRDKLEQKYEFEQAHLKLKHEIEREKHLVLTTKQEYENQLEQERKEWEKTKIIHEHQIKGLEDKNREMNVLYNQAQNKIDELQKNVVKAIRKRERAESHAQELDRALQEMVSIHKTLVKQGLYNLDHAENRPAPEPSDIKKSVSGSKKTSSSKVSKKKVKEPRSSSGKKRILLTRSSSTSAVRRPTPTSRPKSSERPMRSQSPSTSRAFVPRSSINLQERFKKASMIDQVPFISSGSDNSFNVNGLVQKSLNMGVNSEKRMYEEPYNYYGANTLDPIQTQMLDEIDAINSGEELDQVLKTLEEEYKQLNKKYNALIPHVPENPTLEPSRPAINIEVRTEEMRKVLNEMEKKGKMLSFLKQYKAKVADQIREATSPPRIRGAEKRVKALRLINELRSMNQ